MLQNALKLRFGFSPLQVIEPYTGHGEEIITSLPINVSVKSVFSRLSLYLYCLCYRMYRFRLCYKSY